MIKQLLGLKAPAAMICLLCFGNVAQAIVIDLTASLDGMQAANGAGTGSLATGTMTGTLDTDTLLFSWNVQYSGLGSAITLAHFHGPAGPGAGGPTTVILTTANPEIGSQVITQPEADDLLNGLWYINVHTMAFPGDEIRGQVQVLGTPTAAAVPIPSIGSWAGLLMMLGLMVLGSLRLSGKGDSHLPR